MNLSSSSRSGGPHDLRDTLDAGPVTVTRSDGSTEEVPAYTGAELHAIGNAARRRGSYRRRDEIRRKA